MQWENITYRKLSIKKSKPTSKFTFMQEKGVCLKIAYAGLALFSACPPHLGDDMYELQLRLWM